MDAYCTKCGLLNKITAPAFKRNAVKNGGQYVCAICKVPRKKPPKEIVCKNCGVISTISHSKYYKHKNPPSFCNKKCSQAYQQKLYAEQRIKGKRCSRCKKIKPPQEFKRATGRTTSFGKLGSYCCQCRAEYRIEYTKKVKLRAIDYLGGKCQRCDATPQDLHPACFEFHHREQYDKEFNVSDGKSWAKVIVELAKCDLLCANCHRIVHVKAIQKNGD
jgi:hypothetical protein